MGFEWEGNGAAQKCKLAPPKHENWRFGAFPVPLQPGFGRGSKYLRILVLLEKISFFFKSSIFAFFPLLIPSSCSRGGRFSALDRRHLHRVSLYKYWAFSAKTLTCIFDKKGGAPWHAKYPGNGRIGIPRAHKVPRHVFLPDSLLGKWFGVSQECHPRGKERQMSRFSLNKQLRQATAARKAFCWFFANLQKLWKNRCGDDTPVTRQITFRANCLAERCV